VAIPTKLIEFVRLFLTLTCFCYVAYSDFRFRVVSNWVWLFFGGVGLFFTFLSMGVAVPFVSVAVLSLVYVGVWFFGGYGGADAKGLVTLTFLLPSGMDNGVPFFSLLCFVVGCCFSVFQIVYTLKRGECLKKLEIPLLVYLLLGIIVVLVLT
jgi:Flp pilus assembly protein protease CpaA